jgi:2-methylisocitrate lyase-like PEP mutase family enzyme
MHDMPQQRATNFRAMHQAGLLILPNAWDAGSARLFEDAGSRAIATSSASVAWSLGYPDGEALPVERLLTVVRDIARTIRVPLSVDIEAGYTSQQAVLSNTISALLDAGAIGINIEDGSDDPSALCAKIEAVEAVAERHGTPLFINVRTDVYLRGLAPAERRVDETLARAARYRDAGADGLFVPGISDPDEIRRVADDCGLPLNVMALPGLPDASALRSLGVRRLSAGTGIAQAAYGLMHGLAERFIAHGDLRAPAHEPLDYARLNALMRRTGPGA